MHSDVFKPYLATGKEGLGSGISCKENRTLGPLQLVKKLWMMILMNGIGPRLIFKIQPVVEK